MEAKGQLLETELCYYEVSSVIDCAQLLLYLKKERKERRREVGRGKRETMVPRGGEINKGEWQRAAAENKMPRKESRSAHPPSLHTLVHHQPHGKSHLSRTPTWSPHCPAVNKKDFANKGRSELIHQPTESCSLALRSSDALLSQLRSLGHLLLTSSCKSLLWHVLFYFFHGQPSFLSHLWDPTQLLPPL